jgi:co-chaperonin GroES (HSP10)
MTPIGKYIAIKTIEDNIKTDSGLILSGEDANQLRYKKGAVLAPGTDVNVIQKGDIIYFDKGHSYTMIINEEQVTIIREADVVVVL